MADNKTNLVDLTLLNTAYKINKKRIDNLSEKITTNSLNVGTATTNGTLIVNSGDFSATSLEVKGGMTINGGGAVLPSDKALTLNGGGSVEKLANFDSLTGSVKFGNAVDADGNVTGSAQIVVPTGESLSLSGSANTNGNTTIEGTISASTTSIPVVSGTLSATNTKTTNATTIEGTISASTTSIPVVSGTLSATSTKTTKDTTITGTVSASTTSIPEVSGTLSATSTKTTDATTITGTIKSADITVSGSAVLEGSKLQTTTIKNGTINLKSGDTSNELTVTGTSTGTISSGTLSSNIIKNGTIDLSSNNLTVTSASTITAITEGDKTTIEGVAAIKAKSMELTNTANNSSSLIINNTFGGNITDPNADLSKVALYCTGGIKGAKVFNAVWNDLADAIEVPFDTELEYGYCYKYKEGKVYKTDSYADANVMGIHSDTAGMVLGTKDKGTVCINLAVAGVVLAYVDKEYECGTALVATKEGKLTKANRRTRLFHPERIVATFYKTEIQDFWGSSTHKVAVNGRSWVKVR